MLGVRWRRRFPTKLALEKAVAMSAGTKPSSTVNSKAIEVMKGNCPSPSLQTEDWGIEDSSGKSIEKFREVRDEIRQKVGKLIEELKLA